MPAREPLAPMVRSPRSPRVDALERAPSDSESMKAYVDKEVAQLRSEMLALFAGSHNKYSSETAFTTPEDGRGAEKERLPVSVDHLDQHDSYELCESIWDCTVLIGLDCLGIGESIILTLLVLLNAFVQIYFCIIIRSYGMIDDPLSSNMLDGLLRFRTSVAHRVENADPVSRRSLMSQVCGGDEWLHVSGTQRSLVEDLDTFNQAGLLLCLLALLCWAAAVLAELNSTYRFAQAVTQCRAKSSRIVLQGDHELVLESLSSADVLKVFLISVLPRVVTAVVLGWIGVLYLCRTFRLEDLLLNAIALAFVLDVDELFFQAFVPHRVKSLISGLTPLHLTPVMKPRNRFVQQVGRRCGGYFDASLRLLAVLVGMSLVYWVSLRPFHGRLGQAKDILCSGQQDFVYSVNPASGVIVTSRSAPAEDSWNVNECAVLQLAWPTLTEQFDWSPPSCHNIPDTQNLEASVESAPVVFRPYTAKSLEDPDVQYEQVDFDFVSSIARADVTKATASALCVDQVLGSDLYATVLRDAVGDPLVSSCRDVEHFCDGMNMTKVRALCPSTCECGKWGFSRAGAFKTPDYGCPAQCQLEAVAIEESFTVQGIYPLPCVDFIDSRYFLHPFQESRSAQEQLAISDENGDGNITITELTVPYMRHVFDEQFVLDLYLFDSNNDEVWNASEQASFLEAYTFITRFDADGDRNLSPEEVQTIIDEGLGPAFNSSAYVDANGDGLLSLAEMAGLQGFPQVAPPVPPTLFADPVARSQHYLTSLFEYVFSRPDFHRNLVEFVNRLSRQLGWTTEQKLQVVQYFSGPVKDDWQNMIFKLGPRIPHPRNLTWCKYWASWEITLLLGVSLCNSGDIASIRTVCPEACRCEAQVQDCPASCPSAW